MNGERSFLSAQRTEPQLRHVYAIYVRLYLNRAGIRQDYANYIFAKHKTDSAKSYSHYTRFYALIRRVCTPAKTSGFSSIKRNSQEVLAARFAAKGQKAATTKSPSIPKVARLSRQSRETAKGTECPTNHVLHSAPQSEDVVVAGSEG